ncbi:hypothetical protein Tco_1245364 [Tanacetum coccineum]
MDELEPQHAYDFFVPGPLPGYAGNPNNANAWIKADMPLLKELGEMGEHLGSKVEELMVDPVIDKIVELIVEGPNGDEEVWEIDEEWLMAPVTPPLMSVMPPPSTYEVGGPSTAAAEGHSLTLLAPGVPVPPLVIEDLCTRMGNLEYGHGQLVKKVIQVSDAEVADGIAIGEIGPKVSAVEGHVQVEAKVVSSEVESEKWRRLILHQMYVAIDIATDGREEDFFPRNEK